MTSPESVSTVLHFKSNNHLKSGTKHFWAMKFPHRFGSGLESVELLGTITLFLSDPKLYNCMSQNIISCQIITLRCLNSVLH